jgi:hypothetical protein
MNTEVTDKVEAASAEYRRACAAEEAAVLNGMSLMLGDQKKIASINSRNYRNKYVAGLKLALAWIKAGRTDQDLWRWLSALEGVQLPPEQEAVRVEGQRLYDAECALDRAERAADEAARAAAYQAEYERERPAREKRQAEVAAALAELAAK